MYERFTDRARKAMHLANQEAGRMNHEFVRPEHVVVGLLKEGQGHGARLFAGYGVTLRDVQAVVDRCVPPGTDVTMMGRLPHTDDAKRLIHLAIGHAESLNHNWVGTEHLFLAAVDVPGHLADLFAACGLASATARESVIQASPPTAGFLQQPPEPSPEELARLEGAFLKLKPARGNLITVPDRIDVVRTGLEWPPLLATPPLAGGWCYAAAGVGEKS